MSHSVLFLLLNIMFARFIHAIACIRISFLMTEKYSIVCIYHILFIHASVNGHLSSFYFLAIVTNDAMNKYPRTLSCISYYILTTLWRRYYYHPHFPEWIPNGLREVKSPSWWVGKPGFKCSSIFRLRVPWWEKD